jgi:hypothetical protein
MNDKINELRLDAGISRLHGWPYLVAVNKSGEIEDPMIGLEKFAELIVRECMDCSTWVGKVNMNAIEPVHTAHAINRRIRQHFGVEE